MAPVCWLVRRRLGAFQDGELPPRRHAAVAAHVAACAACRDELARLGRLRAILAAEAVDLPEPTWAAFWPAVRDRLAAPEPSSPAGSRPGWVGLGVRRRLVLAPALGAAALAVLAVLAPWQRAPRTPSGPEGSPPVTAGAAHPALDHVVIQSIETADPDVPVMVYASPESGVTVLWVFGLERTGV